MRFNLIVNYYCYYRHYRNVRSVLPTLLRLDTSATAQLLFVLFPETVSHGEEVPTPLLVHVPHVRLLPRVFCVGFVDQMHQEKPAGQNDRTVRRIPSRLPTYDGIAISRSIYVDSVHRKGLVGNFRTISIRYIFLKFKHGTK